MNPFLHCICQKMLQFNAFSALKLAKLDPVLVFSPSDLARHAFEMYSLVLLFMNIAREYDWGVQAPLWWKDKLHTGIESKSQLELQHIYCSVALDNNRQRSLHIIRYIPDLRTKSGTY